MHTSDVVTNVLSSLNDHPLLNTYTNNNKSDNWPTKITDYTLHQLLKGLSVLMEPESSSLQENNIKNYIFLVNKHREFETEAIKEL